MFVRRFVFLLLLLAIVPFAQGQSTIHVPVDQPTIQAGINAANAGDTVLVAPGTYKETIDFKGKAITVTSAGGATVTIIDANGISDPVANFTNGEPRSAVLNGFTLENGGSGGAGASGSGRTGGVYISASSPTLSNNIITQSHCYGVVSFSGSPLIQGNEINNTLDNYEPCAFADGAAIWLSGSQGYYNSGSTSNYPPAVVLGNLIQNNTESGRADAGGNGGVGVAVWGANALIEANVIRNNVTLGEGVIFAFNTDLVSVVGNLIYGNTAADVTGGIDIRPSGSTVGPFMGVVANNTIFGNTIAGVRGSAPQTANPASQVFLSGNLAQYLVVNNLIVGSSALPAFSCDVAYNTLSITPLVFDHNDIFNTGAGPAYGGACPDQTGTYGNLSADPRFMNPGAGDFRLQAGSPAIDSGNSSAPLLPTDLLGVARIQDATHLGYPVVDMGAYEAPGVTDAAITSLTLTPSTYYGTASAFSPSKPFVLTAKLAAGSQVPTGPVTFLVDSKSIGTVSVDSTGTATLQPTITPGLHAFLATYPGQGSFPPAVSVKFYVLFPKATPVLTLTSSANPSLVGAPVTFTVQVSSPDRSIPSPITLTDGQTTLATLTPDSTGKATFTTSTLALGSHQITASFAENATDNAASATVAQQVVSGQSTTTGLTCTPQTIPLGATSSILATVSSAIGTPTGNLSLVDNTANLTQLPLTNGSASYSYTGTTAGSHTLTATFSPSSTFLGSTGSCAVTVVGLTADASLGVTPTTSTFGSPVNLTARITGSKPPAGTPLPTGSVTFLNGPATLSTVPLAAGVATLTLNNLPTGTDPLSCTYSGDALFAPGNCNTVPVQIAAAPTALSLTSSANPTSVSTPPRLTIHLTANGQPAPAGLTVIVNIGQGVSIPVTTDATGSASLTAPTFSPGSYSITATFAGSTNLLASTAGLTQVIAGYGTSTTLTASPNPAYQGQPVTLSAAVAIPALAPALSGAVTFYDGATALGTAPLNASGQATFITSTLSVGTHTLTAGIGTAGVFVGSTSAPVQETILLSNFAITLNPATIAIHAGQIGTTSVSLTSLGGFNGPLTLSYGPLPTYASARFVTDTVTLTTGGTASVTFQLNTAQDPGPITAQVSHPRSSSSSRLVLFALLLSPLGLRRSRRKLATLRKPLALLALVATCQILSGCGFIGYPYHLVAPGTYQIPITATDANHNQKTAVLTVVVTP